MNSNCRPLRAALKGLNVGKYVREDMRAIIQSFITVTTTQSVRPVLILFLSLASEDTNKEQFPVMKMEFRVVSLVLKH